MVMKKKNFNGDSLHKLALLGIASSALLSNAIAHAEGEKNPLEATSAKEDAFLGFNGLSDTRDFSQHLAGKGCGGSSGCGGMPQQAAPQGHCGNMSAPQGHCNARNAPPAGSRNPQAYAPQDGNMYRGGQEQRIASEMNQKMSGNLQQDPYANRPQYTPQGGAIQGGAMYYGTEDQRARDMHQQQMSRTNTQNAPQGSAMYYGTEDQRARDMHQQQMSRTNTQNAPQGGAMYYGTEDQRARDMNQQQMSNMNAQYDNRRGAKEANRQQIMQAYKDIPYYNPETSSSIAEEKGVNKTAPKMEGKNGTQAMPQDNKKMK
jgi:hypothetical protein